ncbi:MAG TPA: UvrD-helicase domain-containing protein [Sporichthyaceae bacterium]|nr:UvrD-helicase domain-containing protein [Sporichthyaceae bacterium]
MSTTVGSGSGTLHRRVSDGASGLEPVPFDVLAPLPTGTTLLEASAGTGKTWTIAALVTRYVAEGVVDLAQLLLITFGRAATRELRERVRERLTEARDALSAFVADGSARPVDPLLAHLADGSSDVVARRLARLSAATADFDAATIVTTHRFCQLVIRGLGSAADADPDTELVEDISELVREVALDLYVRRWAVAGDPTFGVRDALDIAAAAAGDRHAELAPDPASETGPAAVRTRFAQRVRHDVVARLQAHRAMSFDDLLIGLRDVLVHPQAGPAVAARLREEFRVVLVDEFQDTDPVQWQILRTAFAGHTTLVLIGDPKQAIYAFRGGDLHSYLAAAASADRRAGLPVNWRSDAGVLRGLDAVFCGAALGDDRIVVRPVQAGRPEPLLHRPDGRAAVQLRMLDTAGFPTSKDGLPLAPQVRERVTTDLVAEIVGVLGDGSTLRARPEAEAVAVTPGDIAVLVRTNSQAEQVRTALLAAGVPCVLQARTNVFATRAATDWLALLEALEQPHRAGVVRRLALSAFVGVGARTLLGWGDAGHDALAQQVRAWGAVLRRDGVAALFAAVDADHRGTARLLGRTGGERLATDLRHIADVLHAVATTESLGPAALLTWLRRRVQESDRLDPTAERSRRLDSDARAVQVVTVHMSKGLEFPLVYVPFGWSRWVDEPDVARYHDPTGRRLTNVGGRGSSGWREAVAAHHLEDDGEDLRLLYVAATRARSALTLWWARSTTTAYSSLNRLLFGGPGTSPGYLPDDAAARTLAAVRASGSGGGLATADVTVRQVQVWQAPRSQACDPVAAVLDREIDTDWRRTSYSALTALAHAAGESATTADDPDAVGTVDEAAAPAVEAAAAPAGPPPPPIADLPGGAAFGTLVHSVLEAVDHSAPDLAEVLLVECGVALGRTPLYGVEPGELAAALAVTLRTPLGEAAQGRSLASFGRRDQLSELEFELPLAGGDRPAGRLRLADLAPVLDRTLRPDDPVRAWLPRLAGPELAEQPLRGYLTGSIDAVLRLGSGAYVVVDYKTNRLHPFGTPADLRHYAPDSLAAAMNAADYPLQALLYQVAVHRYLTWRQVAYSPEQHLGGALYLFLRGMPGPDVADSAEQVPGVFTWRPPAAAIVAVSDLLAAGR